MFRLSRTQPSPSVPVKLVEKVFAKHGSLAAVTKRISMQGEYVNKCDKLVVPQTTGIRCDFANGLE